MRLDGRMKENQLTYLWERRRACLGECSMVRKLPGKSILGYFAIYPRINGQVSNDTLPSNLASFFGPPCLESASSFIRQFFLLILKLLSGVWKPY